MKTSIKKIYSFLNASGAYLSKHKEETKFKYALGKVSDRALKLIEDFNEQKQEIEVELANTDKNGSVLYTHDPNGNRQYSFTKEALKDRDKKINDLFKGETFEIEHYYAAEIPEHVTGDFREFFEGFVIKPEDTQASKLSDKLK